MHLDEVPCEFLEPARGLSELDRRGIGVTEPLIGGSRCAASKPALTDAFATSLWIYALTRPSRSPLNWRQARTGTVLGAKGTGGQWLRNWAMLGEKHALWEN